MPELPALELKPDELPVHVGEIEISLPITDFAVPARADGDYRGARLLVRLHDAPVGYVMLRGPRFDALDVARAIWAECADEINAHLVDEGNAPVSELAVSGVAPGGGQKCRTVGLPPALPFVSVVICTRNRTAGAANVVRMSQQLDYPNFEIVVIDNAPSDDSTRKAIEAEFGDDERVRYVLESRPGVSRARNRGWVEARGEIVAYADDDVLVDPRWLLGVVRGFNRAEHVGCVTGLVPSAQLENEVQLFFDQRVAWGLGCRPQVFDMAENRKESPLYPYAGSDFGTGANFSFAKAALQEFGGFDNALGTGAASGGGEDLDAFVATLLAGWRLVYEPTAVLHHIHRSDTKALDKQIWTYGTGLTAFIFKYLLRPKTAFSIVKGVPAGVKRVSSWTERSTQSQILPKKTAYREVVGMVVGPALYLKSRWDIRKG